MLLFPNSGVDVASCGIFKRVKWSNKHINKHITVEQLTSGFSVGAVLCFNSFVKSNHLSKPFASFDRTHHRRYVWVSWSRTCFDESAQWVKSFPEEAGGCLSSENPVQKANWAKKRNQCACRGERAAASSTEPRSVLSLLRQQCSPATKSSCVFSHSGLLHLHSSRIPSVQS